jgi:hypothetical protein
MHYEETLNTLKYAARARKIQNPAKRNIKSDKSSIVKVKKLIRELKIEVESIKSEIKVVKISETPEDNLPCTNLYQRRNSFTSNNIYDFNSDDFLEVICCTKAMSQQKSKIKTLKKFLKFEFLQLQKIFCNQQKDRNFKWNEDAEHLECYFKQFLFTLKDKVRITNNRKVIEQHQLSCVDEEDVPVYINFEALIAQNDEHLEINNRDTEDLISRIKDKLAIVTNISKENVNSNHDYYWNRELEMQKENLDAKIDNLNLKKYLSDIRDKYSDDEEIRSLRDHKIELREALQDKSELVEQFQTDIFMRNKDILKEKKVAACNINNLVIHFQTQILNDVS